MKEKAVVEREVGGGASSAGLDSTGICSSSTKAVLASPGGAAAFSAGDLPEQMGTLAGQQDGGSFMAAAARMEWIERQGNSDGVVDMEVRGVGVYAGAPQVLCTWRGGRSGRRQWEKWGLLRGPHCTYTICFVLYIL